ncbi:hypothetical protein AVEN_258450-1 [Araneus ventricosus]|uniref:Uncharacterized protein n=1 Tax=Araneus ventricosus TaxID=182803 RepID=A0A4Y2DGK8_ARAVE|nr:hypothetical protein AVEN_258450-1 [Araneus ventricosus]
MPIAIGVTGNVEKTNCYDALKIGANMTEESALLKFKAIVIPVKQAENDADILIVETALMISKTHHNSTVIVGENIDLLVTLTARTSPKLEIFLLKPGKGKMK